MNKVPGLDELRKMGVVIKSTALSPSNIYLFKDFFGRTVLKVRDSSIISGPLLSEDAEHLSPSRFATAKDFENEVLIKITSRLWEENNYTFKRTWLGRYVLYQRLRYDTDIITVPVKYKTLYGLMDALREEQRNLDSVLQISPGSCVKLTV